MILYKDIFIELFKYFNIDEIKKIRLLNKKIKELVDDLYFSKYYFDIKKVKWNKNKILKLKGITRKSELNELYKYNNIKEIIFDAKFNSKIKNLPPSITHLTLGYDFNQSVDKFPQ